MAAEQERPYAGRTGRGTRNAGTANKNKTTTLDLNNADKTPKTTCQGSFHRLGQNT